MSGHWLYVTYSPTGTVHLVPFEQYGAPREHGKPTTLCGKDAISYLMADGDETQSGHAATCKTCLARRQGGTEWAPPPPELVAELRTAEAELTAAKARVDAAHRAARDAGMSPMAIAVAVLVPDL